MSACSRDEEEPVPWNLQGHETYMNLRTGVYVLSEVRIHWREPGREISLTLPLLSDKAGPLANGGDSRERLALYVLHTATVD